VRVRFEAAGGKATALTVDDGPVVVRAKRPPSRAHDRASFGETSP
jgi:hypothetical protein